MRIYANKTYIVRRRIMMLTRISEFVYSQTAFVSLSGTRYHDNNANEGSYVENVEFAKCTINS